MKAKYKLTIGFRQLILWYKQNYTDRCFYCGILFQPRRKDRNFPFDIDNKTIDHVVPQSRGGKDNASNRVKCCWGCNFLKATKSIEEFRAVKFGTKPFFAEIMYFDCFKPKKELTNVTENK